MESFSDKLKSLGFKTAVNIPSTKKSQRISLEEKIGGLIVRNSLGEFVMKEEIYPVTYQHGNINFGTIPVIAPLNQIARFSTSTPSLEQFIFLDTETSGLSGGTGTFAFLVGIGRFLEEGFRLQQFIIRDPLEESAMLLHLDNLIQASDIFVTYNGKSFDLPILLNRFRINRLQDEFQKNEHLDLLHVARKIWKNQLPACGLKDLERDVLKYLRTDEDIPGWLIPEIYFEYLRTGETERISNVIYHNAIDIVSLAALFLHSCSLLNQKDDMKVMTPGNLAAIGKAFAVVGEINKAIENYTKFIELYPDNQMSSDINACLGDLYKKLEGFAYSVDYWTKAALEGKLEAQIELSKYFEHQTHEYSTALYWAKKAMKNSEDSMQNESLKKSIQHRILRIERKVGKDV